MNWNKLTQEFKILCIFTGVASFLIAVLDGYIGISPGFSLLLNVIYCIGFLVLSWRDAKTRERSGAVYAAGGWSILGIAYPIAVSFKEKSWNSIGWYAVVAICIPVVLVFALGFALSLMGISV